MNNDPIIIEQVVDAPVEKVWDALTTPQLMKQWYFDIPGFRADVGFEFQFEGGTETHKYIHKCRITEAIPGRKLSHSWRYDGYEGNSLVTFELFDEGNKTRLKLIHEGLETFPADNPDFAEGNFALGWSYIIGTSLPSFVEKETFAGV